jgi:hypothetical protein
VSRDGYTATEALAALAIIGLALGGLTSSLHVIGRSQTATAAVLTNAVSMRSAETGLTQLLALRGPFRSDEADNFQGDPDGFSFTCGVSRCAAAIVGTDLRLNPENQPALLARLGQPRLRFAYLSDLGASPVWPPAQPPPPAPQWEVLKAVLVTNGDDAQAAPVVVARLWADQSPGCEYDPIIQDCRRSAR